MPKRAAEWDKKKGKGTKGETLTFVQFPASSGKGKFYLWLPTHWVEWGAYRPLFKYDPSKKDPEGVGIYHPALADIDLHSVVTEYLGGIEHEGKGLYSIEWSFHEFFPVEKAPVVSTPTSGGSQWYQAPGQNSGGGAADLDKANADLLKTAQQSGAV